MYKCGELSELEIASLTPARISVMKEMYEEEFSSVCPWFVETRLSPEDANTLNLKHEKTCPVYNVVAEEFVPSTSNESDETLSQVTADSGIFSRSETPDTADEFQNLRITSPKQVETMTFGNFHPGEIDFLCSTMEEQEISMPNKSIDFLSNIHQEKGTTAVLAITDAAAAMSYYTDNMLGLLIAHCDSSNLVKSVIDKEKAAIQRQVLANVRGRVTRFIADCDIFVKHFDAMSLVNSLADDFYTRTGRVFGDPSSRVSLARYVLYLRKQLRLKRFTRYLPPYGIKYAAYRTEVRTQRRR